MALGEGNHLPEPDEIISFQTFTKLFERLANKPEQKADAAVVKADKVAKRKSNDTEKTA